MVTTNVRLVSPIGEGAMGSVWLAEHLTLETEVAVKFILAKVANREEAVTRFKREAAVAAKIKSPHIVQVFDQGQMEDGTPYIVMERLEGESLDLRLERVRRLTMRQTAQIVSQVAKGLRAAHKVGIVHRDIKPSNIFLVPVDEGKLIKLVDFGVAKSVRMPEARKLTGDGLLIGTPEYISREQIVDGSAADHRADLWALAVVAYECLIGEVPFGGSTIGMVCANIVLGVYALPSQLREDVPSAIDDWFAKCFATDPEQRFISARDMALAFVRAVPTRVGDIESELLDVGEARFSVMPAGIRHGTKVGVLPRGRELSLADGDLEDDFEDDSLDMSLELTPPPRSSRSTSRGPDAPRSSRRVLEIVDELEDVDDRPSYVDSIAGPGADEPLPVRKMRLELVGAAFAALALAGVVTWFATRAPSGSTPSASRAPSSAERRFDPMAVPPEPTVTVAVARPAAGLGSSAAVSVDSANPVAEVAASAPSATSVVSAEPSAPVTRKTTVAAHNGRPVVAPPRVTVPKSSSHEDLGF